MQLAGTSIVEKDPNRRGSGGRGCAQEINLLGKIALAYFITPYAPSGAPLAGLTPEPSPRYGEYLAKSLGGCSACHTARSLKTGAYLSPFFSGGLQFRSRLHPGHMYVSPNLTPDQATGT